MNFQDRLKKEVMILDGSMGAVLQERGLPPGYAPDLWNLENPESIGRVHSEYVEAGSQIVLTNTFGANRLRLREYGKEDEVARINRQGVRIARKAAGTSALVAGDVGPTGAVLQPTGELDFEEAVSIFREQIRALLDEGVDLIAVETMFDLMEIRAAVVAANEIRGRVPLLAHMTFNPRGMTDTGTDPETAALVLEGLGVDVIGLNCSTGPEPMISVVRELARVTALPISVQPNAGVPFRRDGQTRYPLTQEETARFAEGFLEAGANLVGGCCGTNPEYIRMISSRIKGKPPVPRSVVSSFGISSRSRTVRFGEGLPFVPIGERINPSRKTALADSIRAGKTELIVTEARTQASEGAAALDVNVGVPLTDEPGMMAKSVTAIQKSVELPLLVDSSFPEAIRAGLRCYAGKCLVNSVDGDPEKLDAVLPLVKRFGASVVVLPTGDRVPETARDRIRALEIILKRLDREGIPRSHVVVDCLALVVSAMQEASRQTLETISRVKADFRLPTLLGLSNVSFGLPDRRGVAASFLSMAMERGLDGALLNPGAPEIQRTVAAASLFSGRDPGCRRYLAYASRSPAPGPSGNGKGPEEDSTRRRIFEAVVEGMSDRIQPLLRKGLAEGLSPRGIFFEVLTPAVRHLGDQFGKGIKFIPHLMASAETMRAGMEILNPLLRQNSDSPEKGTVIFATVRGDIHDFGKNICALMLENAGFQVIDLGRNVPTEEILRAASGHPGCVIALSALMTTTMLQMKSVVDAVRNRGIPAKIVVGGAPVTADFAREIGADAFGDEAGEAASILEQLMGGVEKRFN